MASGSASGGLKFELKHPVNVIPKSSHSRQSPNVAKSSLNPSRIMAIARMMISRQSPNVAKSSLNPSRIMAIARMMIYHGVNGLNVEQVNE